MKRFGRIEWIAGMGVMLVLCLGFQQPCGNDGLPRRPVARCRVDRC